VSARHYSEDDLTLYYYGEGRRRDAIEKHLADCAACASLYRDISGTLQLVVAPEAPERGEQYGLEVWQRIRHKLPERPAPWWSPWFHRDRLTLAAAAAMLVLVAFVAGRLWPGQPAAPAGTTEIAAGGGATAGGGSAAAGDSQQRILLTAVAEHLDRSERVLTDIMNAPDASDISSEQRWADDLLAASRLYRQDAEQAGEQSVADVLDDLERSLLEIVNSPAKISAADLEQIRRRIDAAALLFKVRVMGEELRQRELTRERSTPRTPTQKVS
jgi:hypothetical protein